LIKRLARWERAPVKDVVLSILASDETEPLPLDDAFNLACHPAVSLLRLLVLVRLPADFMAPFDLSRSRIPRRICSDSEMPSRALTRRKAASNSKSMAKL